MAGKKMPRQPLSLTPATIRRLKENDPIYQWVDYYAEDGTVETISLAEYKDWTEKHNV